MIRKTGALLVAVLALSVALLGLFLAMRCEQPDAADAPCAPAETLMVGVGSDAE